MLSWLGLVARARAHVCVCVRACVCVCVCVCVAGVRYVVYRLSNLPLKSINGADVTPTDRQDATQYFGHVKELLQTQISPHRIPLCSVPLHIPPPPTSNSAKAPSSPSRASSAKSRPGSSLRRMSVKEMKDRDRTAELAREREAQVAKDKEAHNAASRARHVDPSIAKAFTRQALKTARARNDMQRRTNEAWPAALRLVVAKLWAESTA